MLKTPLFFLRTMSHHCTEIYEKFCRLTTSISIRIVWIWVLESSVTSPINFFLFRIPEIFYSIGEKYTMYIKGTQMSPFEYKNSPFFWTDIVLFFVHTTEFSWDNSSDITNEQFPFIKVLKPSCVLLDLKRPDEKNCILKERFWQILRFFSRFMKWGARAGEGGLNRRYVSC